jgi:tetratricopeptide (TPR) repeat protein
MKDLADKYFQDGNYKDAKLLYLKLLEEGINDPEILYKLGIIENDNAKKFKAYEYFKAALEEKDPEYSIYALIELLKLLKAKKKYKEALDLYFLYGLIDNLNKKLAEELDILIADIYFCLKDFIKAAKQYKRFTNLFPYSDYSAKALFYLAYSLENLPNNPDFREAYRIYQIVIDRFPDTKYFLLSKKRLLYLDRHYLKVH